MKYLIPLLVLICILTSCRDKDKPEDTSTDRKGSPAATRSWEGDATDTEEEAETTGITVYGTRTGAKYHRGHCRYLRKSKIPMTLERAKRRYGPCSVCKPPQ